MSAGYRTIRFLTDEDFSIQIVAEVRRKETGIDMLTAREAGLLYLGDPLVLAYAAQHDRVLLTERARRKPPGFNPCGEAGFRGFSQSSYRLQC